MLLEPGQVHRLLLISCLDGVNTMEQLLPVLQSLRDQLFDTTVQLLVIQNNCFELINLDHLMSKFSQLVLSRPLDWLEIIKQIQFNSFDAAIVFTIPSQSPFSLAYLCYIAGISIRVGQSVEFGGGVLSHWIKPSVEASSALEYHFHLLKSVGIPVVSASELSPV